MTLSNRRGFTLAEAMSALVVAALLTLGLASVLSLVARAAMRHALMTAAAETERTAPAILGAELRTLTAADATFDHDSVRLRAFRGGGIVCARVGAEVTIAWHGVRAPEPEKDSVLLLWEDGESAHRVQSTRAAACDATSAMRIELSGLDDAGPRPVAGFAFETGVYSLSSRALRYRRGAAGRQPLTEETLADHSTLRTHAEGTDAALVDVVLHDREGGGAAAIEWAVALPQGGVMPTRPDR